jgi:hypothetical protein
MATPFLTFTEEQTLAIGFMFDTWEKLRYVAENNPPFMLKGYMHTESEDHGGGFVSHIATIDPDVAFSLPATIKLATALLLRILTIS